MGKIIGIDLGTTNSAVAVMENGVAKVIENAEGTRTTPSVVAFSGSDRLVGATARRQSVTNPKFTYTAVKRLIGKKFEKKLQAEVPYGVVAGPDGDAYVVGPDGQMSPQEISAQVLSKMKESAENYLGTKVTQAVITVPAYFNDAQRQATKDAGTIAGLEVLRIINEPTAAALAFGIDKTEQAKTVVVVDLGGGTMDVSILDIGGGVFEVKSTAGDTHLGGEDFDQRLVDYFAEEFKKSNGIDLRLDPLALQRLKSRAEEAKKELSTTAEYTVNEPFIAFDPNAKSPLHLALTISRSKFESLVDDLIKKALVPCQKALKDSKLTLAEIDEVLLVGGMTRMPKFQEAVKVFFGREPNKSVNPDEVVAVGAAIQAGVLQGDVKDVVLLDVTPLSLGIETLGGVFSKLIERNTTIPTRKTQVYSTAQDNQPAVTIKVFQGEREMANDNRLLGQFDLTGIGAAPRGMPQIEVAFDIDANGITKVSATDKGTGKEQKIEIKSSGGLSEEDIKRMVREAEENAEADKEKRAHAEERNSADGLIAQANKALERTDLSDDQKSSVELAIKNLEEALTKDENIAQSSSELFAACAALPPEPAVESEQEPTTE